MKKGHFRLTCVAQKRCCLSSLVTDRNCNVYQHIWGCIQEYFQISLLQGFQYYFPENFRCNITYYESENFSDSFLHPKILSVHFCTKICSARAVKCEKLNFRKSQGIYQVSMENSVERSSRNFSPFPSYRKLQAITEK